MPEIRYAIIVDDSGAIRSVQGLTGAISSSAKESASAFGPLQSSMSSIKSLALAVGGVFTGWQIAQIIREAVNAAVDFEKAMANVQTLVDTTTKEGQRQFADLKKGIVELPPELGRVTDLSEGMYEALSAGVKPAAAVRFVGEAAIFARAALTDTRTSVDVLTTVLNAYGLEATKTANISSSLFKTIEIGKLTGDELASSLGRVIPVAAAMNVPLNQVNAALASMTAGGLDADEAVTALRQVLVSILSPTKEARKALADAAAEAGVGGLTFESLRQTIKEKGLLEAMGQIARVSKDNSAATSAFFGNVRALIGVLSLTGPQANQYKDALREIEKAYNDGNRSQIAFEKQMDTVSGKWGILVGQIERAIVSLGIERGLKGALDAAAKAFTFVEQNATAVSVVLGATLIPVIVRLLASLTLVKDAIAALQILTLVRSISGLGQAIAAILPGLAGITGAIGTATAVTLGWQVALVAGTALLLTWISSISGLTAHLVAFAKTVADVASAIGSDLLDKAKSLALILEDIESTIIELVSSAFQPLKEIATDVGDVISEGLGFLGFDSLVRIAGEAIDWLIAQLEKLVDLVPSLGQLRDLFANLAQATGFVSLAEQIRSFRTEAEIVVDTTNTLRESGLRLLETLPKEKIEYDKLREAIKNADDKGLHVLIQAMQNYAVEARGPIKVNQQIAASSGEAGKAVRVFTEEETKLISKFKESLAPATALAKQIDVLSAAGVTNAQIVAVMGDEILKAADAQRAHGLTLPPVISSLEGMSRTVKALSDNYDKLTKGQLKDLKEQLSSEERAAKADIVTHEGLKDILKQTGDGSLYLLQRFYQLGLQEAALAITTKNTADLLNQAIDPALAKISTKEEVATQIWRKYGIETGKVSEQFKSIGNEVSTVFTNMAQGIADSIVNWKGLGSTMINSAKSFAKGVLSIFVEELFNPLRDVFRRISSQIASVLSGARGTVGGGGAGGIGLGGILGGGSGLLTSLGSTAALAGIPIGINLIRGANGSAARGAVGGAVAGVGGLALAGGISASLATGSLGAFGGGALLGLGSLGGPVGLAIAGLAALAGFGISRIGAGRREANTIVPVQNQATAQFSEILDNINQLRESGQLTIETLDEAISRVRSIGQEFFDFADDFSRAGPGAIRTIRPLMEQIISDLTSIRPDVITSEFSARLSDALSSLVGAGTVDELHAAIDSVNQTISDFSHEIESIPEDSLNQIGQAVGTIADQLDAAISASEDSIRKASDGIFSELDSVSQSLDEAKSHLQDMRLEVGDLNSMMAEAVRKLNDASYWEDRRTELLNSSTQDLQRATESLRSEYSSLSSESVDLKNQFESLQSSIAGTQAKLEDSSYWEQRRADIISSAQQKVLDTQNKIADLEFGIQEDRLNAAIQYGRSEASREAARVQLEALANSRAQTAAQTKQQELDALKASLGDLVAHADAASSIADQTISKERADLTDLLNTQRAALQDVIKAQESVSTSLNKIGSLINVDQEQVSKTDELIATWQRARDAAAEAAVQVDAQITLEKQGVIQEIASMQQRTALLVNELIPAQEQSIEQLQNYQGQLQAIIDEFGLVRTEESQRVQETTSAIRDQIQALIEQRNALEESRAAITNLIDTLTGSALQPPTQQPEQPPVEGSFGTGGVVYHPMIARVGEVPEAIIPLSTLERSGGGDRNINITVSAEIMTPDGAKAGQYVKEILLEEVINAISENYNDAQPRITRSIRIGR